MKNKKSAFKNLFILCVLTIVAVACDKDFISLDSDISGGNNFGVSDDKYEVIAYNKKLGPVQTNSLPANLFGFYKDAVYGNTTANFVTQLSPASMDPIFPEGTVVDSVVLTIPYFSTSKGIENGKTTYKLDSVFGNKPINFKIYENNYFLRDFDPNSGFDSPQKYYSDRSTSASNKIPLTTLQGALLATVEEFLPSNKEIKLKEGEDSTLVAPSLRLKLDPGFWHNKIILKGGQPELKSLNSFQNYFRGIYFEAEAIGNDGTMMLLNLTANNANITMHYSSPPKETDGEREKGKYMMGFANSTKVNFFENDFTIAIPEGNPTLGDEKLYLKGGQGSMAVIDLFGGTNIDTGADAMTEFEIFKNAFVETDDAGKFVRSKRLVNEANLVFYVDQELMKGNEPDRIYVYDAKNKTLLFDYDFNAALERASDDKDAKGVKYKIKITEHIKNLLTKDSTNVSLGVTVSINVNAEFETLTNGSGIIAVPQNAILSPDNASVSTLPVSSILSPKGTILYGNATNDPNKKLYLEIFYTEPNN